MAVPRQMHQALWVAGAQAPCGAKTAASSSTCELGAGMECSLGRSSAWSLRQRLRLGPASVPGQLAYRFATTDPCLSHIALASELPAPLCLERSHGCRAQLDGIACERLSGHLLPTQSACMSAWPWLPLSTTCTHPATPTPSPCVLCRLMVGEFQHCVGGSLLRAQGGAAGELHLDTLRVHTIKLMDQVRNKV